MSPRARNTRDFDQLERRRMKAAKLLNRGVRQADVARQVRVSRESVRRWSNQIAKQGATALKKAERAGRRPRLSAAELEKLEALLREGPEKAGFTNGLWTLNRIAQVIRRDFKVNYHSGHVWWILREKLGWSCQRPVGRARERNEAAIRDWKENTWPALKKKPSKEGRIIVFVDESGLSQRPHRVRTWSKRGVTPILQHQFNWDNLSMAAGITLWQFYFRLYEGNMGKEEVRDFVQHLSKQISHPILLIWDRLPGHRSRIAQDYLASLKGKIEAFYLPAYAPELNPVEYIWAHLKQHELPNFCPRDLWNLSADARSALRSMQRRRTIVTACWRQASLF